VATTRIGGEPPVLVLAGALEEPLRDLTSYRAVGGYAQLERARATSAHQITEELIQSNLRGRGGAFFPTGRKASFIPTPDKIAKPIYLTVNADERSATSATEIMLRVPHRLPRAASSRPTRSVEARFIYIRGEHRRRPTSLPPHSRRRAVRFARRRGLTIHRGRARTFCGVETAPESLEGSAQPRSAAVPRALRPYASPTLINNVETIANVPKVLELGPDEYAKIGSPPDSTGTRVFCLSGNVNLPGAYEGPHGITVRHLIDDLGGGIAIGRQLKAVMVGGSSFPVMTPDDLDTKLDANSLGAKGLFIGSGVITAVDDRTCIVQFALRIAQFYMHESCGKCTPCRVGTRWLVQILRAVEDGSATENDLELLLDVCDRIIGKCLCVLGDSAAMPVASCVTKFRDEFRAHLDQGGCPFGGDSTLAHLFAPVDQHAHTAVPAEVTP
jgi:NADH-quinone oxidoreductase subunit F